MPSSYQIVLWKQESFAVPRPLQIEFFRNLLRKYGFGLLAIPARASKLGVQRHIVMSAAFALKPSFRTHH